MALLVTPSSVGASGLDPSLCRSAPSRLSLPDGFPLNVCWNGANVTVWNNTPFVAHIRSSGDATSPVRVETTMDPPSLVIAHLDSDPSMLPPGYKVTYSVGPTGAQFTVDGGGALNVKYAKLRSLQGFIPGSAFAFYTSASDFVDRLTADSSEYEQCKAHANFIGRAACVSELVLRLAYAAAHFGKVALSEEWRQLVDLIDTPLWANDAVSTALESLHAPKSFAIAANPTSAPPPARPTANPVPTARPTAPTVAPPRTPAPTPVAPPTAAPPPAPRTYAETAGGVVHTWTNYSNAGGQQGASIPTGATVQVACRITGFAVADGDTWWYRLASGPWNGAYYASADAFYNNGQTSGSLHGTPFVDPNVTTC